VVRAWRGDIVCLPPSRVNGLGLHQARRSLVGRLRALSVSALGAMILKRHAVEVTPRPVCFQEKPLSAKARFGSFPRAVDNGPCSGTAHLHQGNNQFSRLCPGGRQATRLWKHRTTALRHHAVSSLSSRTAISSLLDDQTADNQPRLALCPKPSGRCSRHGALRNPDFDARTGLMFSSAGSSHGLLSGHGRS